MSTASKRSPRAAIEATAWTASSGTTRARDSRPRLARLAFRLCRAARSRSTKVAQPAPRDSASRPRAPLPAKRSSTRTPSREPGPPSLDSSAENRAPRTRSGVGRVVRPVGAAIVRPRCSPAMMRIVGSPLPHSFEGRAGRATLTDPDPLRQATLDDDAVRAQLEIMHARLLVTGGSGFLGRALVGRAQTSWRSSLTWASHEPEGAPGVAYRL